MQDSVAPNSYKIVQLMLGQPLLCRMCLEKETCLFLTGAGAIFPLILCILSIAACKLVLQTCSNLGVLGLQPVKLLTLFVVLQRQGGL